MLEGEWAEPPERVSEPFYYLSFREGLLITSHKRNESFKSIFEFGQPLRKFDNPSRFLGPKCNFGKDFEKILAEFPQ